MPCALFLNTESARLSCYPANQPNELICDTTPHGQYFLTKVLAKGVGEKLLTIGFCRSPLSTKEGGNPITFTYAQFYLCVRDRTRISPSFVDAHPVVAARCLCISPLRRICLQRSVGPGTPQYAALSSSLRDPTHGHITSVPVPFRLPLHC